MVPNLISPVIYVIIQCGCEGIEALTYATLQSDDAVNKIKALRQDILNAREHMDSIFKEFGKQEDENYSTIWDRMYFDKKISNKEHSDAKFNEPDAYCIRKWDGEKFTCVCKELGCEPSKQWLM